jgi:hypothetical protein
METIDIARIHRAEACLLRACAVFNEADAPSLTAELIYHLEMMLKVNTKIGIFSGELAQFTVAPGSVRRLLDALTRLYEADGQRTVTTIESESACQE